MQNVIKTIPDQRKVRELPRKMSIEEVEEPKERKSTSFTMKNPCKTISDQRKARELPRNLNIQEVEEPKKYENYHAKPVSDPCKTIAEHRKVRELPRKMNIEEVRAGNYENYHAKPGHADPSQAESTRMTTKNAHASTKPRK